MDDVERGVGTGAGYLGGRCVYMFGKGCLEVVLR